MTPETALALDAIWRIEAPKLIAGGGKRARAIYDAVLLARRRG